MLEGGVDGGVGRRCSAAEAFEAVPTASMCLGARGLRRLYGRIRPRHSNDEVARTEQILHDCQPMNPVAPGTSTRICASLISFQLRLIKGSSLNKTETASE